MEVRTNDDDDDDKWRWWWRISSLITIDDDDDDAKRHWNSDDIYMMIWALPLIMPPLALHPFVTAFHVLTIDTAISIKAFIRSCIIWLHQGTTSGRDGYFTYLFQSHTFYLEFAYFAIGLIFSKDLLTPKQK